MQQVFFITDDSLTVMLWQKTTLLAEFVFHWNENNNQDIKKYLAESSNVPASIILDLLEEEITLVNIPHVYGRDRNALIERTMTRLHRSSQFTYAKVVGRADNARRDDRLLVTGLTSDHALQNWLDLFNEHELHIHGIYSLPLASFGVLNAINMKKGLVLLISRQTSGFIRQSIFNDGVLIYSRNIPAAENLSIDRLAEDLKKTQKYLENQKIIDTNAKVRVVYLVGDALFNSMKGLDDLLPAMDISYVRYENLKTALGIESDDTVGGREVYAALLLRKRPVNHYARPTDTLKYRKKRNNLYLNVASVVLSLALLISSGKYYLDSTLIENKSARIVDQLNSLQKNNNVMEQDISKLPVKVANMKVLVDSVEELQQKNKKDFEKFLVQVSQVLQSFSNIELSELNWNYNAEISDPKQRARKKTVEKDMKQQSVEIKARFNLSDQNRQKAAQQLDLFMAELRKLNKVKQLTISQRAIKAESSDRMMGTLDSAQEMLEFSVLIEMSRA